MRICLVATGLLLVSPCFADDLAVAKKEIQAQYLVMDKAFAGKDAKTFESIFSDNFTVTAPGRPVMNRSQFLRDFEGQMMVLANVKWVQDIKTISLHGRKAHISMSSDMRAKAPGQDGKTHDLHLMSQTKQDWIKTAKGWLVLSSATGDLKITMDGKLLKRG